MLKHFIINFKNVLKKGSLFKEMNSSIYMEMSSYKKSYKFANKL